MDSLLIVAPSTLAISSLETIPQSVAATPSLRNTPPKEVGPSEVDYQPATSVVDLPSPSDFAGSSRRSSVSSYLPIPGSYFPAPGPSRVPYASSSGNNTPSERPRPSPISIPSGTADAPLFSAYPDNGLSKPDFKGKGRAFDVPINASFALSPPIRRSRPKEDYEESSADEWATPFISTSRYPQPHDHFPNSRSPPHFRRPSHPRQDTACPPGLSSKHRSNRKRAVTVSHSPPGESGSDRHSKSASSSDSPPNRSPVRRIFTPKAFSGPQVSRGVRRRRASLGSAPGPAESEFEPPGSGPSWPYMARQVAQRQDAPSFPGFAYEQPTDSDYTLQSVSTIATVRPLGSPGAAQANIATPSISPRRSSLDPQARFVNRPTVLGLSAIGSSDIDSTSATDFIIPDDMVMPHVPPPRGSSLDFETGIPVEDKNVDKTEATPVPTSGDRNSIASTSLTNTDTSGSVSAAAFSPSSSKEHPLSSATTSLSRSAKSGKEGDEQKDPSLSAVRLQRSLEWEAKQAQHRRQVERRKMIIIELVETEVAYAEDLKTLCHVYLPQVAALPSVMEWQARAIARNIEELLAFHTTFSGKMVNVLKAEGLGYGFPTDAEDGLSCKVEKASRKLAALFVDDLAHFTMYKDFCADSIIASSLVRQISNQLYYEAFEKRCSFISAAQPVTTLKDLLDQSMSRGPHHRTRLHFKDYLITPIQRICRYPLLLGQLLESASPSSPDEEHPDLDDDGYDVGVDVERALGAMRGVAEEADEARRLKDAEVKSATVLERLESHPSLTSTFIRSLGTCRLIGSLDVLHHHPTLAPLLAPAKVKYLAAFLYRGYLILAKVKKNKTYEAKHFLPLEVFELIDITEGFLPHSIRLTLRDHNFDLAAACEEEKDVWSAAICQARDESVIPPFELPASVSSFPVRPRRASAAFLSDFEAPVAPPTTKRHTLAGTPSETDDIPDLSDFAPAYVSSKPATPTMSPIKTTFGFTAERRSGQPGTILLRRASNNQRMLVERGIADLFSDICATVRNKAQLHHTLFLPDVPPSELRDRMSIRDSTMLRRRRSFLDGRTGSGSFDIAFTGDVKGSVIELRPSRSQGGRNRTLPLQRRRGGSVSLVRGANDSGNESGTAVGNQSDFGTLGPVHTRSNSVASFSPMMTPRRSIPSLRNFGQAGDFGGPSLSPKERQRQFSEPTPLIPPVARRYSSDAKRRSKGITALSLSARPQFASRASSSPSSPALSPSYERFGGEGEEPFPFVPLEESVDKPALVQKSASDQSPRRSIALRSSSRSPAAQHPVMMEYFIPPPHGSPLETIGNNVPLGTSQSLGYPMSSSINPDKPIGTTWGTLRRSMSFLPLKSRGSVTSMEEAYTAMQAQNQSQSHVHVHGVGSSPMSASNSGSGSVSGSGSGSGSAENETMTSRNGGLTPASASGEGLGGVDKDTIVMRAPTKSPVGSVKRKKSLRLFGLRGFTPI